MDVELRNLLAESSFKVSSVQGENLNTGYREFHVSLTHIPIIGFNQQSYDF